MTETELKKRTKTFALSILKLIESLPETRSGRIVAAQLGRAGTSVAANYRAACRSRSRAEMASKLAVVEEEADESAFWLEVTSESGMVPLPRVAALREEASELTAIMVASQRTIRSNNPKSRIQNPQSP